MCGQHSDPLGNHHLTCKYGFHRSVQHDRVATVFRDFLRALGHVSRVTGLDAVLPRTPQGGKLVLDAYGEGGGPDRATVGNDISVIHPCAASHVREAAVKTRAAVEVREGTIPTCSATEKRCCHQDEKEAAVHDDSVSSPS